MEQQQISLVGLLETRVKAAKMGALYLSIFRGWCFTSNIGWHRGGRIVVAWDPHTFSINEIVGNSQFMHLQLTLVDRKIGFNATIIYAYNKEEERRSLWRNLILLQSKQPWIVMGDFNDILSVEDRIGVRGHSSPGVEFRSCVNQCGLENIPYCGSRFTWNNKQLGEDRIYSKIDRVMANGECLEKFENAEVIFLKEGYFDHTLAVLTSSPSKSSGKKVFLIL